MKLKDLGKCVWKRENDESFYDGEWRFGLRHGTGVYSPSKSEEAYESQWEKGELISEEIDVKIKNPEDEKELQDLK